MSSHGISLIEVLISLVLLSIILLELDASQITSLKKSKIIYDYAIADQQINNIAERLSLEKNYKNKNNKNNKSIIHLENKWNEENKKLLNQGKGKIIGNYPDFEYSISWGGYPIENCISNKTNKINKQGCLYAET